MKTKLKPVIRYGAAGKDLYPFQTQDGILFLCLPLTKASRKTMVEAMADATHAPNMHFIGVSQAKAALAALEGMAKTP